MEAIKKHFDKPVSARLMAAVLSLFTLVAYHYPLFRVVTENTDGGLNGALIVGGFALAMLAVNFFVYYLLLFLGRIVGKVILALTFICNGIALYFIVGYEVLITDMMMGNVFNTRFSEASGYFSLAAVLYTLFLGIVPALYILLRKVDYGRVGKMLKSVGISLLVIIAVAVANMQNFPWIDRNATQIGSMIMPWSYTVNSVRYYNRMQQLNRKETPLPDATITNQEREVCVVVIGESARRENFSLYGYERETNPLLKGDSVVAIKAKSAATYTTEGVRAILSYKASKELYEILPNYLERNGADVVWRSTNWGEPPLHIEKCYPLKKLKELYPDADARYDSLLFEGLREEIEQSDKAKMLVVLHTSTSHGPTYFQKYPAEFERFTPVCTTVEMSKADLGELMNAYDNTILYTDYILHSVIEILRSMDCRSSMMFISDHGESLGENGLYMHGMPMSVAPAEQYEIPFIVWTSDSSAIKSIEEAEQYHIFHSVLDFLHIASPIYNEEYSIFAK